MSLTSGPINETKAAAEEVADHTIDHVGKDAPGILRQCLDALAEYEFIFFLRKKQ